MKEKNLITYQPPNSPIKLFIIFLFSMNFSLILNAQTSPKNVAKSNIPTQSILASAGGIHKFSEIELEWTLGESFVGETTNSSRFYTIGFHQPFIIEAVALNEKLESDEISLFPNPVGNKLNVKFSLKNAENGGQFKFLLTDLLGKQILEKTIDSNLENALVDIPEINTGAYQVKIMDAKNKLVRTFKIIKTNQ